MNRDLFYFCAFCAFCFTLFVLGLTRNDGTTPEQSVRAVDCRMRKGVPVKGFDPLVVVCVDEKSVLFMDGKKSE